jgi:hypothetical protein
MWAPFLFHVLNFIISLSFFAYSSLSPTVLCCFGNRCRPFFLTWSVSLLGNQTDWSHKRLYQQGPRDENPDILLVCQCPERDSNPRHQYSSSAQLGQLAGRITIHGVVKKSNQGTKVEVTAVFEQPQPQICRRGTCLAVASTHHEHSNYADNRRDALATTRLHLKAIPACSVSEYRCSWWILKLFNDTISATPYADVEWSRTISKWWWVGKNLKTDGGGTSELPWEGEGGSTQENQLDMHCVPSEYKSRAKNLPGPLWFIDKISASYSKSPWKDFSSSLCVQTGSGAHPASYPMGTGVLSRG